MNHHKIRRLRWILGLGLLAALGTFALAAPAQPAPQATVSPELSFLLAHADPSASPQGAAPEPGFGVLIRTRDPDALRRRGVVLDTVAGDVVSARVTPDQIRALAGWPEVIYIEGASTLVTAAERPSAAPELDVSLPSLGVDEWHKQGIMGKGVVVGVVDTGVDWRHLDFRLDGDRDPRRFEERSRILGIWDQTFPGQKPAGFSYGVEYTQVDIEWAIAPDGTPLPHFDGNPDAPSHGTHALGIAGGDGSSSSLKLVGMAPEADLVVVKSAFTSPSEVVDGVRYIFNLAGQRPAVASLSLGSHLGAHDGTSNFERALDALAQQPGRAIVAAAGNEGDDAIHVGGSLASITRATFAFDLPDPLDQKRHSFDFWYEPSPDPIAVSLTGPSGETLGPIGTGERFDGSFADGGVFVDNASQGRNPNNGLNELLITVYGSTLGANLPLRSGRWTIELWAPGLGTSRYDGWALNAPFTSPNADRLSTVRIPATANHVIAVGAYVSRTSWPSIWGTFETYRADNDLGQIAAFSSLGPTRDGRLKPDLTAPGSMVASSLSSDSRQLVPLEWVLSDGVHAVARGTSFAAPHVAGVAALLLQQTPTLNGDGILRRLNEMALRDTFTGFAPNTTWGQGKLAVRSVDSAGGQPLAAVVGALDANENDLLDDDEVIEAVRLWVSGEPPAGGAGIDDQTILWLVQLWIVQADLAEVKRA